MTTQAPSQLWAATLGRLQLEVPRPNFETWLKGTQALRFDDECLVIGTESPFAAAMLEERLATTISRAVERIAGRPVTVRFEVIADADGPVVDTTHDLRPQASDDGGAPDTQRGATDGSFGSLPLNPRFTFDEFVVGPSNELAHAAATRVAAVPGSVYNPLYLYAKVGLGKTHLLQAIGNELNARGMQVIYVSSERFTNDYIRAIQAGTTEQFRAFYRGTDALLMDDIQFIAGKSQTQEGFFHTFNELHMAGRQVVVTGDEPARQSLLEERIQSRLEGGLVVDIQAPDYETRTAILREKAKGLQVQLPEDVLDVVASRPFSNVRELEGSLNRIVAYGQMTGTPITVDIARRALGDLLATRHEEPATPSAVITAVSEHFGTDIETLKGPRRTKEVSLARHVAMYLLRETSSLSSPQVGLALGGRDHSTVLYAQRKMENLLKTDPELRNVMAAIRQRLANRSH
ncbi:MAG: chromosomal replication initiator protein DnaA [Chloroflexi bacterium]|nr:chromosomal replication initiator protein DnaA [Chloroflexota bacterium]MCH8818106.1 chromosomal replication initiator protein DnaA [Chloroflexota bacterium]